MLRETIAVGWPNNRADCPEIIHGYWNYRDELGVEDGIILKGSRCKDVTTPVHIFGFIHVKT